MSEKKLRRYEITYLVQPEATDEERAKVEDRVAGVFSKMGAHVLRREDWGKRKLAYEIRKYNKAYYTYLIFAGTADVPAELERNLRLLDVVVRFMVIILDREISLEAAKAEIAAEEELRAQARARAQHVPKEEEEEPAGDDEIVEETDNA